MLSWNCNGGLRRKLKDTQLNRYFCKFDVVFLCEAKKVPRLRRNLTNKFQMLQVERNSKGGGLLMLIQKRHRISMTVEGRSIIKVEFLGVRVCQKQLVLLGCYFAPEGATNCYAKSERTCFMSNVVRLITQIESDDKVVMVIGDTNARVGNLVDQHFAEAVDDSLGHADVELMMLERNPSCDVKVNENGHVLCDVCRGSMNTWLLNGRILEQTWTFARPIKLHGTIQSNCACLPLL